MGQTAEARRRDFRERLIDYYALHSLEHMFDIHVNAGPFRHHHLRRNPSEALIPLAGVMLGVLASSAATFLHERATFSRSMAMRWDDRRIETYIGYTAAVKDVFRASRNLYRARDEPGRHPDVKGALDLAESQRSIVFETVVMLASPKARHWAGEVNSHLWAITAFSRDPGSDPDPQGAWDGLESTLFEALNAFHAATRLDLGVEQRDSDRPASWQARRMARAGRTARL